MTGINLEEWQIIIKITMVVLAVVGAMFGVTIMVVKHQLTSLSEGQKTLFKLVNDQEKRIRSVEFVSLANNHGNTTVFKAIVGDKKLSS